ncbi:hypothetical protein B5V88_12210 [Heyndrickxia sporothermodurans]|nr:hypothetical protein B5V88_12210 [Heyndrickxia sporothermodurans]PTY78193.1 hypothetical protein B5V89_12010 [Heyndrickxia sporothermodurans]PTY85958.1 hypothetical protein B5V91_07665 [Heyndrickxia sporothermodurans]PTY91096.1 hypothetical protein B5V90_05495 [Heyndrickxia sporothermodurans]
MIGAEGCETPAGSAGQVRPRKREALRRLTACPAESEHPGAEITCILINSNKVCENSHCFKKTFA